MIDPMFVARFSALFFITWPILVRYLQKASKKHGLNRRLLQKIDRLTYNSPQPPPKGPTERYESPPTAPRPDMVQRKC
jgi:hypothetical protein